MEYYRARKLYPQDFHEIQVDYCKGVDFKELHTVAKKLGLVGCDSKLAFLIKNCYECFIQRDCKVIEINPLVWTKSKTFRAANPSIIIDDDSLYRQSEMQ